MRAFLSQQPRLMASEVQNRMTPLGSMDMVCIGSMLPDPAQIVVVRARCRRPQGS